MKNHFPYKYIFILVFFSLLPSCATVVITEVIEYPSKPKNCHLDVYMSPNDVGRPYEEICVLTSVTGSNLFANKSYEHAIELTKPKACKCGADAIVVSSVEKISVNLWSWGEGRAEVKGIRYK